MILLKKTIRSMWDNKGAYIACIVLITLGVCIYVAMSIACNKLLISQNRYYENNNLAEVFADVTAIPASAEGVLLDIEGIREVNFRVVHDARLNMEHTDKIVTMRLVSIDTDLEAPINMLNITGRGFYDENDILVAESFLAAHQLEVNDSFKIIISGRETEFNIAGTAESPEYVYMIKDQYEMLPDAESFSVGFMPADSLTYILGKENEFNNIVFMLEDGYAFDDVKLGLEDVLSRYGLELLYSREDQVSYAMLKGEIDSNLSMATTIPFVFVFIAVVVLYLMLKRVIEQDRGQIGTMKAFGYSNMQILGHYLVYGLITGTTGSFFGVISGYYLSGMLSEVYNEFFKLPAVNMDFIYPYLIKGLFIGIIGGLAGAYVGTRSVIKLTPSEAMKAPAPKIIKKDIFEYFPFLKIIFDARGNMAVRSIVRSKFRSVFIVMGIMFSFGMLAFMGSYSTMIDDIMFKHFTNIQVFDGKVTLTVPLKYNEAVETLYSVNHIQIAEGILEIPAKLHYNNRNETMTITGINPGSELYKIYDNDKRVNVNLTDKGIILSNAIADKLEVSAGDSLLIKSPLFSEDKEVIVTDVVTHNLGSSCYMDINALQNLFETGDYVTGILFKTDNMAYVKDFLKEGKNVGFLEDKTATFLNYYEYMGSYDAMIVVMEIMAVCIAFAIIYNTAVISLSERKREYATLRVLGMHTNEVGEIMALEYWILTLFGIIFGIPFTYLLKSAMDSAIEMEAFTFPTYTPVSAFIIAAVGCIISVFISNKSCVKNIKNFDMVEVLKERE